MGGLLDGLYHHIAGEGNFMFQAKWNTDLTIRCQDQEFHVHKIILGMQSGFFRRACDPDSPFREARTGVIDLHEDDAFLIRILLVHCYTGDWEDSCIDEWCRKTGRDQSGWEKDALCTARIYSLADKYQILPLKKDAQMMFKDYLNHSIWESENFDFLPGLVREVYLSTPDTDRGLRDLVLFFLCTPKEDLDVLQDKRFRVKTEKIQGFWRELFFYKSEVCKRERKCPGKKCGSSSAQAFPDWTVRHREWQTDCSLSCPYCKNYFTAEQWNRMTDLGDNRNSYEDSSDDEESPSSPNKRKRLEGSPELGMSPPAAKTRRLQVCDGI